MRSPLCAFLTSTCCVWHAECPATSSHCWFSSLPFLCPTLWRKSFLLSFWDVKKVSALNCEFQIWNSQVKIDFFFLMEFLWCYPFPCAVSAGCRSVCLGREERAEYFQGTWMFLKTSRGVSNTSLLLHLPSTRFLPHGAELHIDLLQGWSIWGRFSSDLLLVK